MSLTHDIVPLQRAALQTCSSAKLKRYKTGFSAKVYIPRCKRGNAIGLAGEQGEPWIAALAGHHVDPLKQQAEQQRLMLERFQQEVPE